MKKLMNSAVIGTIFLVFLATSFLLAQMGEATGEKGNELEKKDKAQMDQANGGKKGKQPEKTEKAQKLDDLREKDIKFYETIVVPMAKDCATGEDLGTAAADVSNEKKQKLCEAKELTKQLNELHHNPTQQITTKQALNRTSQINTFRKQILAKVFADLVALKSHYPPLLRYGLADGIQENVNAISNENPKRVYLNAAFKETVVELIVELKKKTKYSNYYVRDLVYKLLCIGQRMALVFTKNLEEKMEWAYQQFALNLVIHSLLVDHQKSADTQESTNAKKKGEALQKMAKMWPFGMAIKEDDDNTAGHAEEFIGSQAPKLTNLTGMPKDFYGTIVVPMVRKCANRQFDVRSSGEKIGLCARVKKIAELFVRLNAGQNKDNGKNGEEITPIYFFALTFIIVEMAIHDLFKLQADQKLAYDVKIEIQDEAMNIAQPKIKEDERVNWTTYYPSIRVNLTKAFGEAFGQIIEELKSVKNVREYGTNESQMVAYKLLCIGDRMRVECWKVNKGLAWALQQTVANLAIHALRLDQPSQGEIQQIVASWPIGMFADERTGEPSQGHHSA